jgi:hypothetical protein
MNRTHRAACAATFCGLLWTPFPAEAAFGDPEIRAGFSAGYNCFADDRRYHGLGGALGLQYAFGPTFALISRYGFGAHHIRDASFRVQQLGVGGRFQLDVFEYVPWLEATRHLVPEWRRSAHRWRLLVWPSGLRLRPAAHPELRPWASRSAHYHQIIGESRYPAYLDVGVRVGYRWSFWRSVCSVAVAGRGSMVPTVRPTCQL